MSSELYSGPSRALWELLQNADDCSYDQEAEIQIEQIGNDLWTLGLQIQSELLLIFFGSHSQDSPRVKASMSKQNAHLAEPPRHSGEIINMFANPRN